MEEWVRFLLGISARASLVLLAACAASLLLRRASAAARHAVWAAALLAVLALPALVVSLPPLPAAAPAGPARVVVLRATPAEQAPPPARPRAPQWPEWTLVVWAAGAAVVLARLAAGLLQVRAVARGATSIDAPGIAEELGLRRPVPLRQSPHVGMPLAWGIFRPMVLLPQGAGQWPAERLRAVLLHELAHVQRQDCLLQLLSQMACALYWFHPLAWLAAARLRREREQACDDRVLSLGTPPPDYAQHLLELARTFTGSRQRSLAVVAMARPSGLRTRLAGILDPNRDRRAVSRRGMALAAVAALAVLLPVAASTAKQEAGISLEGIVRDPSGARVPGALVLLTFPGTDRKEAATAGPVGDYRLRGLPEGRCTVEVSSPGFAAFRRNLVLHANTAERLDVTLSLGGVSETVDVVGKRTTPPPPPAGGPQRIRVGGNVQATRMIYSVKPEYPDDAKARGVEGTVLLRAVISIEGVPLSITPLNTGVDPELVKAAVDAVRQWRYEPTRLNGQPVEVVTTITVNYRLEQ